MQTRTIIDGQQRLTTLQLLLDALHAELLRVQAVQPAMRLEPLVLNAEPFCVKPEDRFKVWPTNRDRQAFNAVMHAPPPVDHDALPQRGERLVEAHRFFSQMAREWLSAKGTDAIPARAAAVETVVRELLQMVVIDLTAEENAQEIFETLNARGAQLTAADLIKNFIFQRLAETNNTDVERAYEEHWKEFETAFWETELSVGRIRYPRSSVFLNHWLVSRTGEEVVAREVFERFKRFADHDAGLPMPTLLPQIHAASAVYRRFTTSAESPGDIDRVALFGYRTGVQESEVIKPLILCLLDPELSRVPDAQLAKALDVVESWMVRRMLVRATTKNYNQVVAELVSVLKKADRTAAGDAIEAYLASQKSDSRYWPDDAEIRHELADMQAYRRLSRGRLRMVLEGVEDHLRGWKPGQSALGGERVARGRYAIEHVMPRKWSTNWPNPNGPAGEIERDRLIHTLGNLTLITGKLNSKLSNASWLGDSGKRHTLNAHDVFLLNRDVVKSAADKWDEESIRARTRALTETVIQIWPVPAGHRSDFAHKDPSLRRKLKLTLADLINAGVLQPGMTLYPQRKKLRDRTATLLPDGQLEVDGQVFAKAVDAASAIRGRRTGGWWFFLVDPVSKRSLRDVRSEYVQRMAVDVDEDDPEDDDEDDES